MSCNPAMGGIAKGQIVREIDALGYSGIVSDNSATNKCSTDLKGRLCGARVQSDRSMFALEWRKMLENTPGLYQEMIVDLIIENESVVVKLIGCKNL